MSTSTKKSLTKYNGMVYILTHANISTTTRTLLLLFYLVYIIQHLDIDLRLLNCLHTSSPAACRAITYVIYRWGGLIDIDSEYRVRLYIRLCYNRLIASIVENVRFSRNAKPNMRES